jgi:uncharacterized protein involved in outer membrane biogenesis
VNSIRKWWKAALAIVAAVVLAQVAASILVRTPAGHDFLLRHLERAFGRPVEVRHFEAGVFPWLRLDAEGITVADDPSFGNEYFLRADNFSAALRWFGLLRGRFEFGTIAFSRPSLVLVRNSEGHWNLERWLPPAPRRISPGIREYGPQAPAQPANRLQKIVFDDGRINFKFGEDKLPFAFTGVSGSVEQSSAGRWELQLDAQPWRSGVQLQSAGTVSVRGSIAGTSTRLQPASFSVRWQDASLADLFRLFRQQDYGVRGSLVLDGALESGAAGDAAAAQPGDWSFRVNARAGQIHRWDLAERNDNPRLSGGLRGRWNPGTGSIVAGQWLISAPRSNLRGSADFSADSGDSTEVRVDSASIEASDLMAWYRAFHSGVSEELSADQFFSGSMKLRGWPFQIAEAKIQSDGGLLHAPGFAGPVRLGSVRGGLADGSLVIQPVTVSWNVPVAEQTAGVPSASAVRRATPADGHRKLEGALTVNAGAHVGAVSVTGNGVEARDVLKLLSAFGHSVNHGWDLQGSAAAALRWAWAPGISRRWQGAVAISNATLQVAGVNEPIAIGEASFVWTNSGRQVRISRAAALGANWTGTVNENAANSASGRANWNFDLHADRLDAADLDHWIGPRARPGWLQRLLPALLGGRSSTPALAGDLLRHLSARGTLLVDEFAVEKIQVKNLRANLSVIGPSLEVEDGSGQWAGGTLHTHVNATFVPSPQYAIVARFERVNLTMLPFAGSLASRVAGTASGTLRLAASGVGRQQLLDSLEGSGELRAGNTVFRGADLESSVIAGDLRPGASRWIAAECDFRIENRQIDVERLHLEAPQHAMILRGTVGFDRHVNVTIEPEELRDISSSQTVRARNLQFRGILGDAAANGGLGERP